MLPVLVALLVTLILWDPPSAWAWGPTTHIQLGESLLSLLAPGAGALAGIITRHARDFLYGNVAADVVQAKRFAQAKRHCHSWPMGLKLFDNARDDHSRAFALGYLCHLAADCVAHNKFVPRQMTLSRSRTGFSHPYWEMRADALAPAAAWATMRTVVTDHWPRHDELMEDQLTMPLLSFDWNKRFFTRVALTSSARSWRRGVRIWHWLSRWPLDRSMLGDYHAECLARMVSLMRQEADSPVLAEDPVGSVSFASTRMTRRLLRQMARAGILRPEVLDEAVAHLGPSSWPLSNGDGRLEPADQTRESA